jgi:hypothetical protein
LTTVACISGVASVTTISRRTTERAETGVHRSAICCPGSDAELAAGQVNAAAERFASAPGAVARPCVAATSTVATIGSVSAITSRAADAADAIYDCHRPYAATAT